MFILQGSSWLLTVLKLDYGRADILEGKVEAQKPVERPLNNLNRKDGSLKQSSNVDRLRRHIFWRWETVSFAQD